MKAAASSDQSSPPADCVSDEVSAFLITECDHGYAFDWAIRRRRIRRKHFCGHAVSDLETLLLDDFVGLADLA